MLSNHTTIKPRTYTQIHTPTMVQGVGGGGTWKEPSPEFLMCCSISKRFYLQWKAFNILKMRYLLWVVALPEQPQDLLLLLKKVQITSTFTQKWLDHLLPMISYLVTIETDHR